MDASIVELGPGDETRLEAFLVGRVESSMFLRANPREAGLALTEHPHSGTYVAAVDGGGGIVAVAAHYRAGAMVLQAPVRAAEVACACADASGRNIEALLGPFAQVVAARTALGMDERPTHMDSRDILFRLDLDDLVVPDAPGLACRLGTPDDLDVVVPWRAAYCVELLGETDGPTLRAESRAAVLDRIDQDKLFVLARGDELVSMTSFNAALPDIVQVGGVWTPPELRGRGYARTAVAGSLVHARERGVATAVLFTGDYNVAAQRPYRAIGFTECGDYALVLFD